ncbi:MAG TPA: methyltransferase domain-containing protein [Burkholderiales bacterium]|nr:methyltransferase domain-containing protein [Burkholderiales bacterium]
MAQDSSKPDFWETRYRDRVMPWDAGGVPASLREFAPTLTAGARILIPGCGSAYEAAWLADAGFDVLAIDFSAAAVEAARQVLGRHAGRVREADFFTFDPGEPFDVIYERAFLCALPRKMWPGYAPRCARLLRPGGCIAGFYFFADTPKGPPFGTSQTELDTLLLPGFKCCDDRPVADSIEVFRDRERWQVWKKKGA